MQTATARWPFVFFAESRYLMPMRVRKIADLSPLVVVLMAIAWPIIVLLGAVVYAVVVIWQETRNHSAGVFSVGFGSPPLSEAWPAYVILFLPSLALLSMWWYLRQRGASVE